MIKRKIKTYGKKLTPTTTLQKKKKRKKYSSSKDCKFVFEKNVCPDGYK